MTVPSILRSLAILHCPRFGHVIFTRFGSLEVHRAPETGQWQGLGILPMVSLFVFLLVVVIWGFLLLCVLFHLFGFGGWLMRFSLAVFGSFCGLGLEQFCGYLGLRRDPCTH